MARFSDKNILITGGTSGMGLAAAKRIADEGGRIAVTGQSENHLEEARQSLPNDAIILQNDAGDPAAADRLAETIQTEMGGVDGLWLNAGFGIFEPNDQIDAESFDKQTNVNVRGPVLQMAKLLPHIADGGSVVVTASVSPYLGQAQGAVYAASKGAVTALTRSWAADLAGRNVRVNSIAPGPIDTNFMNGMGLGEDQKDEFLENVKTMVPLGRLGKSEEVAAVALFLLSGDASYVTGSQYMVDGGMTFR